MVCRGRGKPVCLRLSPAQRQSGTEPEDRSFRGLVRAGSRHSLPLGDHLVSIGPDRSTSMNGDLLTRRSSGGPPRSLTLRTSRGLLPVRRVRGRALVGRHGGPVLALIGVDVDDLLASLGFCHDCLHLRGFPIDVLGSIVGR